MAKGSRVKKIPKRLVEYNGDEFEIAIIRKGIQLNDEEKLKIGELVCLMYGTDEHSLENCLEMCGIKSDVTWYNWIDAIGGIEEMYIKAQIEKDKRYRRKLKKRGRTVVERMMEGYIVDLVEKKAERIDTGMRDEQGKPIVEMRTLAVTQKQIYVRPSPAIIKMAVFNVDRDVFKNDVKEDAVDNELMASEIKVIIEGGIIEPITDEDDIKEIL